MKLFFLTASILIDCKSWTWIFEEERETQSNDYNPKFHGSSQLEDETRQAVVFKHKKILLSRLGDDGGLVFSRFLLRRMVLSRLSDRSRSYQRDALYYFLPARIYPDQPLSSSSWGTEKEKKERNEIRGIRENKLHKYRL